MDLTEREIRVLGCLVEKQMTTPDYYPMTQNALENACNQSTSRDPVVGYTDGQVIEAINGLRDRGWVRAVHASGQRAVKYRHVLDEVLMVAPGEAAVVAVLLLRGDQTAGELRTRTTRYHEFAGVAEVGDVLAGLAAREEPLVVLLDRRPGEKESRWRHLLGGGGDGGSPTAPSPAAEVAAQPVGGLEAEVAGLRDEVRELRDRLDRMAEELGL